MAKIKLKVLGVSYSLPRASAYALILMDEQDMYRLPIVIGMLEAQSIAIQMEGLRPQRPLTHDLIKTLADALGATLKEIFIYRLDAGIYYSELLFVTETGQLKIDSRTSDAIALALRYDCPIYTTTEILNKGGILVKQGVMYGEAQTPATNAEVADEEIVEEYTVEELQHMLDEAIQNEEYEKASKIRDMLKEKKGSQAHK